MFLNSLLFCPPPVLAKKISEPVFFSGSNFFVAPNTDAILLMAWFKPLTLGSNLK